ncbi:hypothetical protein [Solirubrobacter soli]|uniref:hypothetical protein n=1 Tax=Solirubrobacter soli TaxID=363832 RepID=UPI0012F757B6|nr:hypothetical protein [Solirubrobacter soli]
MLIEGQGVKARRTELFDHVVGRASSDAPEEADRRFAFHFPLFLSELLDDVDGGDANTVLAEWAEAFDWIAGTTTLVGQAMVSVLDADKLRAAAGRADKPETAMWLERLAAEWPQVRAWIEADQAAAVARRSSGVPAGHSTYTAAGIRKTRYPTSSA